MAKNMFDIDDTLLNDNTSDIGKDLELADVLCMREQFDRALSIYNKILDKDIKNEGAYVGILKVHSEYFTKYDSPEIEKDIRIIERMFPDITNKEYVAYCLERKKRATKALEKKEKEEKKNITETVVAVMSKDLEKGMHFVETGQWKRAIDKLEYVKATENNILAYYGLGIAYYNKRNNTKAKQNLEYYFKNIKSNDKYYIDTCEKLKDLYYGYKGCVPDYKKGDYYYEKAEKAKNK